MKELKRIGVDLDGTLAKWFEDYVPDKIGEPIPEMVARVKRWLGCGHDVVILTARVHPGDSEERRQEAEVSRAAIQKWCLEMFGRELEVTCMKDPMMIQIWDDRAVTVEQDTGRILTEGICDEEIDQPDALGELLGV